MVHADELNDALANGLDLPLNALRASMEALNRTLPNDAPSNGVIAGALEEVDLLGRKVRELIEYTS